MLIPQEIIDEILNRTDIVSVVGESVTLQKAGKDFKGLCPFHQEKTPSFWVSPDKRIFHCFGCSTGGNVISFLMKKENLPFPEALERLASKAGVLLPKKEGDQKAFAEEQIDFKINRYAAWFFSEQLKSSTAAKAYLKSREISEAATEAFKLGEAPNSWEALCHFLKEKKVPLERAARLGLLKQRTDGSYYDFFRNRLMFPILDASDRILGFSGRRLSEASEEAKYINSPESSIYHKGSQVYGLHAAKTAIRAEDLVILVEGNLDLVALSDRGIANVVAPLGTALTLGQINLLSRYSRNFVLMMDGDAAGQKSMRRSFPIFLEAGIHPRIVSLPQGEDPDSWVKKQGPDALKTAVLQAIPAMDWVLADTLSGKVANERMQQAQGLMPLLQKLPSELEQKTYLSKIAQFLGIEPQSLSNLSRKKNNSFQATFLTSQPKKSSKNSLERILLGLYVDAPQRVHPLVDLDFFSRFEEEGFRRLGGLLYQQMQEFSEFRVDEILGEEVEVASVLTELEMESRPVLAENEVDQFAVDCVKRLKAQFLKQELTELTQKIQQAEVRQDLDLVTKLLARKRDLLQRKENTPNDFTEK